MEKKDCILVIPGDRMSITLVSPDETQTFFSAGELLASCVSRYMPPIVGGNMYAFYKGELIQQNEHLVFVGEDISDLDTVLEIVFGPSCLRSIKITWKDEGTFSEN